MGSDETIGKLIHDGVTLRWNASFWNFDGVERITGSEDGTTLWTLDADSIDHPAETFHSPVDLFGTPYVRPDDGPWYELDVTTGATTHVCDETTVPLPDGRLEFPYTVRRVSQVNDVLVVGLKIPEIEGLEREPPARDDPAVGQDVPHVTDLGGVDAAAEPVDGAAEFGLLTAYRPILGFERDGTLRWQIEPFEFGEDAHPHPVGTYKRRGEKLRTDLWGAWYFFFDWETGRITDANWKR